MVVDPPMLIDGCVVIVSQKCAARREKIVKSTGCFDTRHQVGRLFIAHFCEVRPLQRERT
jgi:hypothetical protein